MLRPPLFAAALAVLLLAGCGSPADQTPPRDPRVAVIGLDEGGVTACAGPPQGRSESGGATYLVYRTEETLGKGNLQDTPRIPVIGSFSTGGPGYRALCEATFVLRGGKVAALTLRTDPPQDDATTREVCAPLIAHCTGG